ncbi:MAG: hypothetical protein WBH71_08535 [Bacteroidales bacterium]|jgi:hypothetical protein|nr:hypothetical protein [Bacteroidales bacterium]MDI9593185.1 hypothetical protein [Bacteroidota bacterium]NLH32803.1 hypothetical protein [Lentimicrobium sp.]OQC37854.1 MAG: hypothetical protein BWX63_00788 [Bacteroidetes bacterium ADurb.Bin041]HNV50767.1 hypothetical protein [Bacteroidales bacterium]
MQNFDTLNDLIFFAYNAPGNHETMKYHQLIIGDKNLARKYQEILKAKAYLNNIQIGPSEVTIKNIMGFSRALAMSNSTTIGVFDLLLN